MAKNNPKEIMREEKIKKEWGFIGLIFGELVGVCCGKLRVDISGIKNVRYVDVLPLPASAYKVLKESQKESVP